MYNKKGAIELSISTVVIIVLGMTLLIGGIVLVQRIISSSISSIDKIDAGVESQVTKLFSDDSQKTVVRLTNNQIDIKQGQSFGFAVGMKNTEEGSSSASTFTYTVTASDIEKGCSGLTLAQVNGYVILGDTGSVSLLPGKVGTKLITIKPASTAALCAVMYDLNVLKAGQPYDSTQFRVDIKSA
jgi:hypothetical protein